MKITRIALAVLMMLAVTTTALAKNAPPTKQTFKQEMRLQIRLIKKGAVEKMRVRFIERLRPRITRENLQDAVEEIGKYTIDDLVDHVKLGERDGRPTAKVMMKNGRKLTTFVLVDGHWLASSLWFK